MCSLLASCKLTTNASYLVSLFEVGKFKWMKSSNIVHTKFLKCMPIKPILIWLPSTWSPQLKVHILEEN